MNEQLILYAKRNTINSHLARRVHRSIKDTNIRNMILHSNHICHVTSNCNALSVMEYARDISGCDDPFTEDIHIINRSKRFRYVKYETSVIILTEDKLVITTYQFHMHGHRIVDESQFELSDFPDGFIYLVLAKNALKVCKTREEAITFGISEKVGSFYVYVVRTLHKGDVYYTYMGSNQTEFDMQYQKEIQSRMLNASDADLYSIFMEYIGYELDVYNHSGELLRTVWDNGTTKSFMDFADPAAITEMRTMKHPLLWERVEW